MAHQDRTARPSSPLSAVAPPASPHFLDRTRPLTSRRLHLLSPGPSPCLGSFPPDRLSPSFWKALLSFPQKQQAPICHPLCYSIFLYHTSHSTRFSSLLKPSAWNTVGAQQICVVSPNLHPSSPKLQSPMAKLLLDIFLHIPCAPLAGKVQISLAHEDPKALSQCPTPSWLHFQTKHRSPLTSDIPAFPLLSLTGSICGCFLCPLHTAGPCCRRSRIVQWWIVMFTCLGLLTLADPLIHHLWNARSTLTTAATTLPSVLPGPWPLSPKLAGGEFPSCQRLLSRQPPLSHASKSSLPFCTHPFHAHTSLKRACSLAIDGEGPRTLHPRSPQRSLCTSGFTVQRLPQS